MTDLIEEDYHYYYHPEDIPGHDELPDEEDLWHEVMREYYEQEEIE